MYSGRPDEENNWSDDNRFPSSTSTRGPESHMRREPRGPRREEAKDTSMRYDKPYDEYLRRSGIPHSRPPPLDDPPRMQWPPSSSSRGVTGTKKARKKTMIACIHCVKAKTGCDKNRPCGRCVRLGKHETCVNRPLSQKTRKLKRSSAPENRRRSGLEIESRRHNSCPTASAPTGVIALRDSMKREREPAPDTAMRGTPRPPMAIKGSLEMNARLMLDPHFTTAYASAQKTIAAWTRYFQSSAGRYWNKESKLTMAALITWMACADHQGCANQLYAEMLNFSGLSRIEPVQIHAKWRREDRRQKDLETSLEFIENGRSMEDRRKRLMDDSFSEYEKEKKKSSPTGGKYPEVSYQFDYDYVSSDSTLYCTICYNKELIDLFTGEEVLRAMVPLSVKWIGIDNWHDFVTNILDSHVKNSFCTHCHPVMRCTAEVEFAFESQARTGVVRPRMRYLKAALIKRIF